MYDKKYNQIVDKRHVWLGLKNNDKFLLEKIKSLKRKGFIIELGCNRGVFLSKLIKHNYNVLGFDVNCDAIKKNPVDKKLKNKLKLLPQNQIIPLKDNSVDMVISSHTLEHIPNIQKTMKEVDRILKPNGFSIHMVPWEIPGLRGLIGIRTAAQSLKKKRAFFSDWWEHSKNLHVRSFRKSLKLFADEITFEDLVKNTKLKVIDEKSALCFLYAPAYCIVLKK